MQPQDTHEAKPADPPAAAASPDRSRQTGRGSRATEERDRPSNVTDRLPFKGAARAQHTVGGMAFSSRTTNRRHGDQG